MIRATFSMIIVLALCEEQYIRKNHTVDVPKSQHFTLLLDRLLNGYDKNLRPNFGGSPIVVEIDFNVRSMGPISEVDMTFSMDCYFRQTWLDKRLAFSGGAIKTMTLGISTLEKIWKPDTYFFNGKHSYLHTITVPNRFVRIDQDGRVLYSQRLTVKASCPMNLENFPIDTQRCPLELGSFGYSVRDVLYRWNSRRRVVIASDMKMSQFDLMSTPSKNGTTKLRNGEYSTLLVFFYLQRHTGYFLIQVYAPCILLVVLSWVAFWINREATADRVALGVTTILTMTFLGLDSRNDLPKVSYSTALDSFMAISFTFVFATIIQFALVHYFTKRGSGEVYFIPGDSSDEEYDEEATTEDESKHQSGEAEMNEEFTVVDHNDAAVVNLGTSPEGEPPCIPTILEHVGRPNMDQGERQCPKCHRTSLPNRRRHVSFAGGITSPRNNAGDEEGNDSCQCCCRRSERGGSRSRLFSIGECIAAIVESLLNYKSWCSRGRRPTDGSHDNGEPPFTRKRQRGTTSQVYQMRTAMSTGPQPLLAAASDAEHSPQSRKRGTAATIDLDEFNSVSKIDSISRVLFPASFVVINLFYWYVYLSQNEPYGTEI